MCYCSQNLGIISLASYGRGIFPTCFVPLSFFFWWHKPNLRSACHIESIHLALANKSKNNLSSEEISSHFKSCQLVAGIVYL